MRNKNIVADCVVCSTKKMVDNQHPLLLFGVEVYRKVYYSLCVLYIHTRWLRAKFIYHILRRNLQTGERESLDFFLPS